MTYSNIDFDEDVYAAIDAHERTKKDLANDALREYLGIEELSSRDAIDRRIKNTEADLRDMKQSLDELMTRIEEHETQLERLRARREELEQQENSLDDDLDEILETMLEDGVHVFEGFAMLKEPSKKHDLTDKQLIAELRARRDERGLDIPDSQFQKKSAQRVIDGPEVMG